jgi:hypothetical protein
LGGSKRKKKGEREKEMQLGKRLGASYAYCPDFFAFIQGKMGGA